MEQSPINEMPVNNISNTNVEVQNNSEITNDVSNISEIPNNIPSNNSILESQNNFMIEDNLNNKQNEIPSSNNIGIDQSVDLGVPNIPNQNTEQQVNNIGQEPAQFNFGGDSVSPIPEINLDNNETL